MIERGDTVQLKSGGPVMTVKRVVAEEKEKFLFWQMITPPMVVCTWFDIKNQTRTEVFHPDLLKKI